MDNQAQAPPALHSEEERDRAIKRLRKGIEALFASARDATLSERTAYIEIGEGGQTERYVYVVFANGAVKMEGIPPRPATSLAQSVTAMIKAVADHYPDHATQQMVWRCDPSYEVADGVAFNFDRNANKVSNLQPIETPWFLRARLLAMPLAIGETVQ